MCVCVCVCVRKDFQFSAFTRRVCVCVSVFREPVPCPICRHKLEDSDVPSLDWQHLRPYSEEDIDVGLVRD